MVFESPNILWALPLALLPTLIHLLGKRPRKTVPIPSLMWMNTFKTSQRRRQKVRDLIVLALRTLAILAVVLGLSRPNFSMQVQELVIDNHPALWQQGTWLKETLNELPDRNYNVTTRDGARFENIPLYNLETLLNQWPASALPLREDSNALLVTAAYTPIPSGFKAVLAPDRDSLSNSWISVATNGNLIKAQLSGLQSKTNWFLALNDRLIMEWRDEEAIDIPTEQLLLDSSYVLSMNADSVVADNEVKFTLGIPRENWLIGNGAAMELSHYKKIFKVDSTITYSSNEIWSTLGSAKNLMLVGFNYVPQELTELNHNVLIFPSNTGLKKLTAVMPVLDHPFYGEHFIAPSLRNNWPNPNNSRLFQGDFEPLLTSPQGIIAGFSPSSSGAIIYQQGFVPQNLEHPYYRALHQWIMRDRDIQWTITTPLGFDNYLSNERKIGFQSPVNTDVSETLLASPMQIGLLLALVFALIALIFVKIF